MTAGASWGLGGGGEASVSCRPPDLSGAVDWASDRLEDAGEAVEDAAELGEKLWHWGDNRLDGLVHWLDD